MTILAKRLEWPSNDREEVLLPAISTSANLHAALWMTIVALLVAGNSCICRAGSDPPSKIAAGKAAPGKATPGKATPPKVGSGHGSFPDYAADVAPIFRKYCIGCHNAQEAEGGLVLESHAQAMHGGEHGAIVAAGNPEKSRLIRVLEKREEPSMPPEGNKGPSAAEIAVLKAWIQAGAHAPARGSSSLAELVTPKIEPIGKPRDPISAVAYSPDGQRIAVARYGSVEILNAGRKFLRTLSGPRGSVNDVGFSADGKTLFGAAGEAGLFGELTLWNTADWSNRRTLRGHRDALLTAEISPDGRIVATGSYDQTIRLWDMVTGKELKLLKGHNGPVFDLAFDPTGRLLASASGDRTVKLWDVASGERLDTFSQPTKDQYAVVFSPDGHEVIAGGVDSRIRVWRISSTVREGTNELVQSLFAHDGPILRLTVSRNGRLIASSSEDSTIKVWDTDRFTQIEKLSNQADWVTALAISPDNHTLLAGRSDGSLFAKSLRTDSSVALAIAPQLDYSATPKARESNATPLKEQSEKEPNDSPAQATELTLPAHVHAVLKPRADGRSDADYYRFHAKAGETWIVETEAARKNSPADTRIDVLHLDGSPVLRCLLRAVRDSAINFRPIDSRQSDPRLDNWEEMQVDQFLYMSGEVSRLFRAPRGPDSGFDLYSENGGRRCYFDTSAVSHALNEPVYIVEPYAPGTKLADNGLPIFPLSYSNDDDGSRKLGRDSRLSFAAPAESDYLVRVTDVRGFGGPNFTYSLTIREPKPDFRVSMNFGSRMIPVGGGHRFVVALDRLDDFEDEVRVDIDGVPRGYHISTPMIVQKGQLAAVGTLNADPDAKTLPKEAWKSVRVTASATVAGRKTVKQLPGFTAKAGPAPKYFLRIRPDQPSDQLASDRPASDSASPAGSGPSEVLIEPGQTVTALLRLERHGFDGEMRVDVENLPHGVIVDNIGLSKIMIRAGENERQVSITAAKWVPPGDRWIHAAAEGEGGQTSFPILLRIAGQAP